MPLEEQVERLMRRGLDVDMPVWVLTELLEPGHLSTLYRGMLQKDAEEVALAFGISRKKTLSSWLASLNYVRNVAAHHARLFNRKLQNAPSRPAAGVVPLLDHLRETGTPKGSFGTYNALAIMGYMLRFIEEDRSWALRMAHLLRTFPTSQALSIQAIGVPRGWEALELWRE